MLVVNSDTKLFNKIPQRCLMRKAPEEYEQYQKEINEKWTIVKKEPIVEKPPEEPQQTSGTNKPKLVKIQKPAEHKALIQGSQGHKLFAMLSNIKPQARKPQPTELPTPKETIPKRKLGMSKNQN